MVSARERNKAQFIIYVCESVKKKKKSWRDGSVVKIFMLLPKA